MESEGRGVTTTRRLNLITDPARPDVAERESGKENQAGPAKEIHALSGACGLGHVFAKHHCMIKPSEEGPGDEGDDCDDVDQSR